MDVALCAREGPFTSNEGEKVVRTHPGIIAVHETVRCRNRRNVQAEPDQRGRRGIEER